MRPSFGGKNKVIIKKQTPRNAQPQFVLPPSNYVEELYVSFTDSTGKKGSVC
jgi:hypothetical protein